MATTPDSPNAIAESPPRVIISADDARRLLVRAAALKRKALNLQLLSKQLIEEAESFERLLGELKTAPGEP